MPAIDSILKGEWDENAQRKDFTPSESVELMEALLPEAERAAAERKRKHGGTAPGKKAEQDLDGGRALDRLASYLGRDRKTLEKAKAVVEAAREQPKKFGDLLAAMDKSGKVNGPWRRLQIARQVEEIKEKKANGRLTVPEGKFDRMVADVSWPHEPDDDAPDERARATRPYPPMSIEAIKALPVRKMLAKHVAMYFWTTNFHMEFAYQILRTWGFDKFPTIITWVKDKFSQGQRLRNVTEHVIVAIKGNPTWDNSATDTTVLYGPRREHSRKPDEFYALIDRLTPAQRSVEFFPRRELPEGWVGFGDQVGKFKAEQAKADKDRERLRKRAARLGHEVAIALEDADADNRVRVLSCSCGGFTCRLPERENVEALTATAIDEHLREAVASAPAARDEAADKTARRGSRRAKRPPAGSLDEGALARDIRDDGAAPDIAGAGAPAHPGCEAAAHDVAEAAE
jgi:N6-adenosine-specific RNA methylase IME4